MPSDWQRMLDDVEAANVVVRAARALYDELSPSDEPLVKRLGSALADFDRQMQAARQDFREGG